MALSAERKRAWWSARQKAIRELKWNRLTRSVEAFYDWQDLKIAEIEALAGELSRSGMAS